MTEKIPISDFQKLDLRVAKIREAQEIPNKDKLLKLKIDLGDEQRTIVAGIKQHYKPSELINKKIIVIANLQPATLGGIESNGMLLAASDNDKVILLTPDSDIQPGSKIS